MNAQSFFYWGLTDLASEVNDDILAGLVQPKRSLFYNRGYGAGLAEYENAPMGLSTNVMMRYEATKFMAVRNSVVTDGNLGPDRRAATSQELVSVEQEGPAINARMSYIMLADMTRARSMQVPIGGAK